MTKLKTVSGSWDDYATMSEDGLREVWRIWHPSRNDSKGPCRVICAALETVAKLRGFDITKWEDQ